MGGISEDDVRHQFCDLRYRVKRKEKKLKARKRRALNGRSQDEWLVVDSIRDVKAKQFIKRQLIERDGAMCALCGRPILDMKDCTVDHIRPRAKGGLTTIDNCQLAHRECNRKKGDAW